MYKLIIVAAILMTSARTSANEFTQPVYALLDAIRTNDAIAVKAQFSANAILQRANANGAVVTNDIAKFSVAISHANRKLDEQLLLVKSHRLGNIASVWAPYVFYIDGKISHCGVNSFQLVNVAAHWKIQYLIDNVFSGDCATFITRYR